ncbi:MAG: gamma-glutamyltranspeptidase / glutathione hydrolase [Solirubrobacteraceae bacterium]|nr:gamma-glutamyltranspeptidase / glutathione hydrolase [Solirubrobacteraceae bacterium]
MRPVKLALITAAVFAAPAAASPPPIAEPVEVGTGGAVATVDPYASRAALGVLRNGGNAVDAAVAGLAALGVVEPYSTGIGGGGFMLIRTAAGKVTTIDGRETAPASMQPDSLIDPATGSPYPFSVSATSPIAVGVPGALRAWEYALRKYGTRSFRTLLKPAIRLATDGFEFDNTLAQQTKDNLARFRDFTSTAALYLTPDGQVPAPGTVLKNPGLAATLQSVADGGADAFYSGPIADDIAATVQHPPLREGAGRRLVAGGMTAADIAAYQPVERAPTHVSYRGRDVYGMGPPSSGGSTIGEALNILSGFGPAPTDRVSALHAYMEASALAYADRNAYLGDPAFTPVPLCGLLSSPFADARRATITGTAAHRPVAAGDPAPFNGGCGATGRAAAASPSHEGLSTSHLTVADKHGNVVSATFTIEQIGGTAITVPGRGILLNNELTDFDTATGRPNSPQAGKRPRSSMAPTIVTRAGKPVFAVGSPGGATIITTVLQILVEKIDLRKSLAAAIEAPRISDRNGAAAEAEPDFMVAPARTDLEARGHVFTQNPEIGAATGIEFLSGHRLRAIAEARRRGGGSAMALP